MNSFQNLERVKQVRITQEHLFSAIAAALHDLHARNTSACSFRNGLYDALLHSTQPSNVLRQAPYIVALLWMFNIEVPQNLQYIRDAIEKLHGDVLDEIKLFLNSRPTVQFDDLFYFTNDGLKFQPNQITVNNVQYCAEDYVVYMLQSHLDRMAGLSKNEASFQKGLLRRTYETYLINVVMMLAMDVVLSFKNAFVYGLVGSTSNAICRSYEWMYGFRYFFNNRHGYVFCKEAETMHGIKAAANMKERRWSNLKHMVIRSCCRC